MSASFTIDVVLEPARAPSFGGSPKGHSVGARVCIGTTVVWQGYVDWDNDQQAAEQAALDKWLDKW